LKKIFYIFLTTVFSLTGYFSIVRLIEKADLPFEYYTNSSGVYSEDLSALPVKYKIISVDGFIINNEFQLEFFLDSKHIGNNIKISLSKDSGETVNENIILTPYYHDLTFLIVSAFVGYVFLLMALFVILKKTDSIQAIFLYWSLTLFGTATFSSPGQYGINGDIIGYINRTLHVLSYSAGGLFFVFFILSFPINKLKERRAYIIVLTVLTFIVALFASIAQINSILNINSVVIFDTSWVIVLALLTISLAYGTIEFVKTIRSLTLREDKRKIEWILWGLTAGVSPYLFLWIIPYILNLPILIKEEYSLAFLIFVPISFVTAVIKYQIMDIELVVKRSFVYTLLSICIIGIYISLIYLSNILFDFMLGSETKFINLLAVLISALSFNPLRNRLNKFADRVFYREKYRFDKTMINFSASIKELSNINALSKFALEYIKKIIPVTKIAAALWIDNNNKIKIYSAENSDNLNILLNDPDFKGILLYSSVPVAQPRSLEHDISYVGNALENLKKHSISVCIPLMLNRKNIIGSILIGEKLSGLRFSWSDIELLSSLAAAFATEIDRISLHEKVIAEEIELAKLEELNRLKSFYVASVSHDLKTPLTSIKVFTELMQSDKKIPNEKKNEYLKIIEGETDRLTRLIDNVLDFAKIEKGIKQYSFSELDLKDLLNSVIKAVHYTLQINKFKLDIKFTSDHIKINGDSDAIKSALFNLINNSIKYSTDNKCINIVSGLQNSSAFIEIEDKGIGIPENDQKFIFDPFFRSVSNEIKGAGLGLAVVKHVMDAHKGNIELYSKINTGTKFRLIFPISEHE